MDILAAMTADRRAAAERALVADVRIGVFWTAVALEVDGVLRAGLASTMGADHGEHHQGVLPVGDAGRLLTRSAGDLLALTDAPSLTEVSVGIAALNALLDIDESRCRDVNAIDIILERGAGKRIAVIGHFPFVQRLRPVALELSILELNPQPGDLPAAQAPAVLPQADVVAITGTSLLNRTFEGLMALCRPDAYVILLGATAPLSPILFERGVDAVAGTQVVDVAAALLSVSQGATFRQIAGKRLLTMFRM